MDDLINLLSLDIEDNLILDFVYQLDPMAKIEPEEDEDDGYCCEIFDEGLELSFNKEGKLEAVFLYGEGNDNFKPYAKPLGKISFSMSRKNVKEVFGNPSKSGEAGKFLNLDVLPWDKYDYESYSLHIQYKLELDKIDRVTLSK